jgi:hypothetical protein
MIFSVTFPGVNLLIRKNTELIKYMMVYMFAVYSRTKLKTFIFGLNCIYSIMEVLKNSVFREN